jgi:hypothetical protein
VRLPPALDGIIDLTDDVQAFAKRCGRSSLHLGEIRRTQAAGRVTARRVPMCRPTPA